MASGGDGQYWWGGGVEENLQLELEMLTRRGLEREARCKLSILELIVAEKLERLGVSLGEISGGLILDLQHGVAFFWQDFQQLVDDGTKVQLGRG